VLVGTAVVMSILWVAWQGFQKNNNPAQVPVEGASPQQLADITLARNQIRADSTNINAQISLANTLFDTANWPEAIIHYKTALRLDPTRVTTVVDLGVCYYSLSDMATAEQLFEQALTMDPRQPIALFNLGIVSESQGKLDKALEYFRRALSANPPPERVQDLNQAIQRVTAKKSGPGSPGGTGGPPPGGGF
jgi:cytochrome c-type biogenesis protein CcmH/NrfG